MFDWDSIRTETIRLLQDLIRINTTNPPGNEIQIALYIQEFLQREGIGCTIHEAAPGRANLVARLPGIGNGKPLIVLSHLDVVPANSGQWRFDPFEGAVAEDYLWGRGALDMKGMLAMELMALVLLKRSGMMPPREIMLVAVADEEAGGNLGMGWLIEQDIPGLKEAEYVINEGGFGGIREGIPLFSCQCGEKGVLWVKLTVPGTPGHASMPARDNAIIKMVQIIQRIMRLKRPMILCETSRAYLKELAYLKGLNLESQIALDYSLQLFATRHLKDERSIQAMLYHTISPTILQAGLKANVLPEACELTLDCRLLPGETPGHFLAEIQKSVNDSAVQYEILQAADPTESSSDTQLFKTMGRILQQEVPQAVLVPFLSPIATDSRFFRYRSITAYGLMPVIISEAELQRLHGIDERLSLPNLERGTRIMYEILRQLE
ncbi:acetylornithine deacetylase/succinyl-diaminopimelate desuccinylase-like protein [Hydrogenispora ethanolica]|jgi:acetylornithine deacetylase/succinyl-diaminopimelate desuccinylase-like protein|uniref:Acetylornithine deacetylase/succinyl-diaminopimelate desuccinylase-like protein n=1 Tax=Hydrogenispora ethanolica TaxID=1082276 RepID=A0A4V2QDI7_HYDET|nr:M20/M25/M40 family metallo-hydrolase [Hydrogenispora ethanolica]TCL64247.1 acetylornithine deacetylase/succinyl-diaminopimelate desuccinylase-like protein [Hydrogenispora ethanolica]